jgi:hypothetical protein
MTWVVESLYLPTTKDRLSGLYQRRWSEVISVSGSGVIMFADSAVVPPDVTRVVMGASCQFQGTTGEPLRSAIVAAMIEGTSGHTIGSWDVTAGGTLPTTGLWSAQTVPLHTALMAGEFLRVIGTWAGGVNTGKFLAICAWGYDVPRANLQR